MRVAAVCRRSSWSANHGYAINEPALIEDLGLTLAGAKEAHALWSGRERGAAWKLSLPAQPPAPERAVRSRQGPVPHIRRRDLLN
jgi:hypothetical protein